MDGNGFNPKPDQQNQFGQPQNDQQGGYGQNPYMQNNYQQGYGQQDYQSQQMGYQGQYNNGGYQQGYDQQYNQQYNQPLPTPGFSIASLVTGILSLVLVCCLNKWDLALAIPAIVLGIIGLKKEPNGKGMAIAGIVLAVIALIILVVMIILILTIYNQMVSLGAGGLSQFMEDVIERALMEQ